MAIRLGVTGLKKTGSCTSWIVWGKGIEWWCNFVCAEHLGLMIGLILVQLMSFSGMVSMVLVLRGVGPILGNEYGI